MGTCTLSSMSMHECQGNSLIDVYACVQSKGNRSWLELGNLWLGGRAETSYPDANDHVQQDGHEPSWVQHARSAQAAEKSASAPRSVVLSSPAGASDIDT